MNRIYAERQRFYGPAISLLNSGYWDPELHPRDSNGEFRYNGGRHRISTSGHRGSNPMIKGSEGFQIALQFIIQEEVTDKNYYNSHDASPSIPGGKSGITIGIGYDLGQVSPAQFQIDWGNLLSASVMSQLLPFVGKSGLTQSALAPIGGIKIPWDAAVTEFEEQTLPQTIEDTRSIYPQLDDLPSESQAALVSLVYNRGNSLLHKDTMIAIQQDLRNGNLKDIPRQFYAMQPIQKALAPRRQREGNLFAKGLARQSTK